MEKSKHRIAGVLPGSIAWEMGLEAGDRVVAVNGNPVEDIFDYDYLIEDEYIELLVEKADQEEWLIEIEKEEKEDLGLVFENGLMDDYHACRNKCIFCFIDQMPPGMRETLYFKDDDSRLSFLQGNYVTLTNMDEHDVERILRYHMSPINISVHTTNPELRCNMLNNRFAGDALKKIDRFYEAGIQMNGQIVLCRGINDRAELERTIGDLVKYAPVMQSVSVVPVGLSRYREGLYPLEPLTGEDAAHTLSIIRRWQGICLERFGIHFVHASDEFYILAGEEIPEAETYDGYVQLENGVGMLRLLMDEACEALAGFSGDSRNREVSIATGKLAAPYLSEIADKIHGKFPGVRIRVHSIRNDFFGEQITVSGLITGQDLVRQCRGLKLGEELLLPINMFRSGEEVFLDDMTRFEVQEALQVPVNIVKSSGRALVFALLGETFVEGESRDFPGYEWKENRYE
ncbi:MAG: DUF512 domain-containing protein [Lachnospiraceae bacterium]|nr:DUF512 domain-containing protein [Lachnospiraceae bacterium]